MTENTSQQSSVTRDTDAPLTGAAFVKLLLWLFAVFAAGMLLFTQHNNFPYFYHPDEPGKARQLLENRWNFHHPLLLLRTTQLAISSAGISGGEQAVVVAGRRVSAFFTAAAVAMLSLVAFQLAGWRGAIATGSLLLLHHQLFELAHYFKEDSALLFGFALALLALTFFWKKPDALSASALGVACAIAISAKYIGAFALIIALPLLVMRPNKSRHLPLFFAALVVTFVAINFPLFTSLLEFRDAFGREASLVIKGQRGMTRSIPHFQYWNVFMDNMRPVLWLLVFYFLFRQWQRRRQLTGPEWIVTFFPIAYAVLLSFSPKSNDRYFLPATAVFVVLAGLAIVDLARLTGRARIAFPLILSVVLALQTPTLVKYYSAFQRDDRRELIEWIEDSLLQDAVLIADSRVRLPENVRQRVLPTRRYAAEGGSLAELRSRGVTHVLVSQSDYGRFFLKSLKPQREYKAEFARHQKFYDELFKDGEKLWERKRSHVIYLHPGIEVFRVPER